MNNEEEVNQALEEVQYAAKKNKCINCGHRLIKLVLVLEGNRRTQNYSTSCPNQQCFRYIDNRKTPSWVPA